MQGLLVCLWAAAASASETGARDSACVSNRGHPYTEANCKWVAKAYGCVWIDGSCKCENGGFYSKSSHICLPRGASSTSQSTTIVSEAVPTFPKTNGSACVSNRGLPYTEENCKWIAKDYGCAWNGESCVCESGGYYAKSSHKCWPPSSLTSKRTTTISTTMLKMLPETNSSTCVSNRGLPYSAENCKWTAKDYGCVWNGESCVCENGGYYAKSSHTCWPSTSTPSLVWPGVPVLALVSVVGTSCLLAMPRACKQCKHCVQRQRRALPASQQHAMLLSGSFDHLEDIPAQQMVTVGSADAV